jgi:hypothetical protein
MTTRRATSLERRIQLTICLTLRTPLGSQLDPTTFLLGAIMNLTPTLDLTLTMSSVAACISILVAILVYTRQARLQRQLSKLHHTYQMVGLIFQNGPVANARLRVSRWIAEGREFSSDEFEDKDDDLTIIMILDYYEYLCEGIFRDAFDGAYVNREHGYRIERTFYLLRHYLIARERRLRNFTKKYGHDDKYELNGAIRKFLKIYRKKDPKQTPQFFGLST